MEEEMLAPELQTRGDTKEGYYIGRETSPDHPNASLPLHGTNVWPAEDLLPGWRATMEAYQTALTDLGRRVNRIVALSLRLPVVRRRTCVVCVVGVGVPHVRAVVAGGRTTSTRRACLTFQ